MSRFAVRVGRIRWPIDGRRTHFIHGAMLRAFVVRERRREAFARDIERRSRDARQVEIAEFIDDDLRHAHARDGIACPICGVPIGAECIYGAGYGAPKWRDPTARQFPGRVHTRRLINFHAPKWPEVQWCEPRG